MARAKKQQEVVEEFPVDDDSGVEHTILHFDQSLDDYEEPELLPEGMYVGEVQEVTTSISQKGRKYFSIRWLIPTDEYPPDYDVENYPDGCTLYYNLLLVPEAGDRRAISNVKKFMQKLGLNTGVDTVDTSEWLNQRAKLRVRHSSYQGNRREEIQPNGIEQAD